MVNRIEEHPWPPFYPEGTRLLMLGSFPPPAKRWSIDFYYPNWQNDMWRIFGLIFYNNTAQFELRETKSFNEEKIRKFLIERKIAISDVVRQAIRGQDNASDRFLEVVQALDPTKELQKLPDCQTVVTTGQKSSVILKNQLEQLDSTIDTIPPVGGFIEFHWNRRTFRWYRMPSSSRAWPRPIVEKADFYRVMFRSLDML